MNNENNSLFERMRPSRALAVMALPTVISQIILLLYNLADTWFIGRTNNPYMIGASSLAATIYLTAVSIANVFGVGGGSLMVRLLGRKKTEDARRVCSYTVAAAAITALVFSIAVFLFMDPLLKLLGASENTIVYGRQYILATTVIGGVPSVLTMAMSQLLRNAGYSKKAGFATAFGSILNIALDPLFMFILLPKGNEVLGAGIATMLANFCSFAYVVSQFYANQDRSILQLPRRLETLEPEESHSLYSVGIPAGIAIFLFDLVTILINRLTASYGDIPLAAMGIVLKLERIPINIGLGVCLGMVPLIAYNYGAGNLERMEQFCSLTRTVILGFSVICVILFWFFAPSIVGSFISEEQTVLQGISFLRGRCFSLPFMMIGYHIVNYMNAVNRGKVSFSLSIIRHLFLIIPIMLGMNALFGLTGLVWSQLAADVLNSIIAILFFWNVERSIEKEIAGCSAY